MNLKMGKGIIEQLLSSGGSFLFFILAARTTTLTDFNIFALMFTGAQLILTLIIQWCLLPIVSYNKSLATHEIIYRTWAKIYIVILITPIFWYLYTTFIIDEYDFPSIIQLSLFSAVIILYDTFKYFFIRTGEVNYINIAHFVRWGLTFLLLYLDEMKLWELYFFSVACGLMSLVFNYTRRSYSFMFSLKRTGRTELNTKPLLVQSASNITSTLVCTNLINSYSPVLFSAFMAFKSLTNALPVALQFVETHLSSKAAISGETEVIEARGVKIIIFLLVILIITLTFFSDLIVSSLYNSQYDSYSLLLPLVFSVVALQSIARIYHITLRLRGDTNIFYITSFVMFSSSLVVLFADVTLIVVITYLIIPPLVNLFLILFRYVSGR